MTMFQNTSKDYFHGIDVALVIDAIKRTGAKMTPDVLEVARDVVADAMLRYDDSRQSLNGWVYTFIQYQLAKYLARHNGLKSGKHAPKAIMSLDAPVSKGDDCSNPLHELVPSDRDPEREAMKSILHDKLHKAIKHLDKRGQFVMEFYLNSDTPRCGQELGEALHENKLVTYRGNSGNKRSRAQQLIKLYLGKMKDVLEKMGVNEANLD